MGYYGKLPQKTLAQKLRKKGLSYQEFCKMFLFLKIHLVGGVKIYS